MNKREAIRYKYFMIGGVTKFYFIVDTEKGNSVSFIVSDNKAGIFFKIGFRIIIFSLILRKILSVINILCLTHIPGHI